jgi:hypothetical protein
MRKSTCQLAFVLAIAAVVSGCNTFRHEEVSVPWNNLPAVVQSTIQAHTYGGTVGKVEKETMKCGIVYEAKVKGPEGQCSAIKVAEDGKLLKYKTWKEKCEAHGEKKHHDKDNTQAK